LSVIVAPLSLFLYPKLAARWTDVRPIRSGQNGQVELPAVLCRVGPSGPHAQRVCGGRGGAKRRRPDDVVSLMAFTSLRQEEAVAVPVENVDLDGQWITVDRTASESVIHRQAHARLGTASRPLAR
jgi:hypothetical protein